MSGTVHTFTTIHIGADPDDTTPYAVVVIDADGTRSAARAEGDLSWLAIGAEVECETREDGIALARPA